MKRIFSLLVSVLVVLILLCASVSLTEGAEKRIKIVTSVAVLADIVKEVGGDGVIVDSLIEGNQCAIHYEPKKKDMIIIMWANAWVGVGAGLDSWIDKIIKSTGNRQLRLVVASEGAQIHEGVDPHLWLDPENAIVMATNVCRALSEFSPASASYFQENLHNFVERVQDLARLYETELTPLPDKRVVSYSTAFSYLLRAFGIDELMVIQPIHGQEASPKAVADAIDLIRDMKIKAVIGDAELPQTVQMIAQETGIQACLMKAGEGNLSGVDTYLGLMEYNLSNLKTCLSTGVKP